MRPQGLARRAAAVSATLILALAALVLSSCSSIKEGGESHAWIWLMQGWDTNAWRGFRQDTFPAHSWLADNGMLRSIPGKGTDLITRDKFENFELELDYATTKKANSGIVYAASEETTESYWSGPEFQIYDDTPDMALSNGKHATGALYDLIAPTQEKQLRKTREFNHLRLVSDRGHVEHWINGKKIVEYDWDGPELRALIAQSKFKDAPQFMKNRNGYIALQHHGSEVWFRNIRIRRL